MNPGTRPPGSVERMHFSQGADGLRFAGDMGTRRLSWSAYSTAAGSTIDSLWR
jgi:hypothetical protein